MEGLFFHPIGSPREFTCTQRLPHSTEELYCSDGHQEGEVKLWLLVVAPLEMQYSESMLVLMEKRSPASRQSCGSEGGSSESSKNQEVR